MAKIQTDKQRKLSPQQELFCRYYTQNEALFGNATLCYDEAYSFDGVGGELVDDLKGVHQLRLQAAPMEPKNKPQDAPKEQYENPNAQCTFMLADPVNKHRMAVKLDAVQLPPGHDHLLSSRRCWSRTSSR